MYLLSEATAGKLRDLIGDTGSTSGGVASGSAHRQISFVKCVTWNSVTNEGTGVVDQRDDSGWSSFGTSSQMLLLEANSRALTVGTRYPALRFGQSGSGSAGKDIFVCFAGIPSAPPALGCGLVYDEDELMVFDADLVAGLGLVASESGCGIAVNAGCGITVDSTGVRVNSSALAGPGLVPNGSCGLAVNPGCGIRVEDDLVKFNNNVVGQGLRRNADGCGFDIEPGCAISLEGGNKIGVHRGSLVGKGLKEGSGCGQIDVKAACGIWVDADGVAVRNVDLAGDCLIPDPTNCELHVDLQPATQFSYPTVTAVALTVSGCTVTLTTTSRTVTVKRNACGLVVDHAVATNLNTTTQTATLDPLACLNLGDLCTYCEGYGTYGGGGTPGGTGYCWDLVGKLWVACESAQPIM